MQPYSQRHFKNLARVHWQDYVFKRYDITLSTAALETPINIIPALETYLPSLEIETTKPFKSGYIIVHKGEEAIWLLLRLWVSGGIVMGIVLSDFGDGFVRETRPLIECVWEAVVTQHERDAWVKHVLTETPDITAYLDDILNNGAY